MGEWVYIMFRVAAQLNWLKKLAFPPSEPWHYYFEFKMDLPVVELALRRTTPQRLTRVAPFFTEIFRCWAELHSEPPSSEMAIRNEVIWENKFLRGKVKKKIENFCKGLGILRINDLLYFGRFMSDLQFNEIFGRPPLQHMLTTVAGLIPENWLRTLSPINKFIQGHSLYLRNVKNEWVELQTVSTKAIYAML